MLVSWNTTNACNLYCKHCYRDAGAFKEKELSTGEALDLIEDIASTGFKIMIFSGGEPLMRDDIYQLVEHASKKGLRPVFGTNGTLIDRETAHRLKTAGALGMGISLDSVAPDKHDEFRGIDNSWQKALDGMRACAQEGMPFQIHTTVMDWNYSEVEEITDLAVKEGARAHHVFFMVPTGRAVDIEEESLRATHYEKLLHRLMEKQKKTAIEVKPTCAPQFMRIASQKNMELRFTRGCIAGISYCIISPTGDVQPCAYLDIPAGNIRNTPFNEIWENSSLFNDLRSMNYSGGCGSCDYKKICGGCRARAYYYNGDYMGEEPWCLYHGRKGY